MGRFCFTQHKYKHTRIYIIALSACAFLSSALHGKELLIDSLVAEVGTSPILHSTIKEKTNKGPLELVSIYPATKKDPEYKQALQDAINFKLVLQKAEELEIEITSEEVQNRISSILKENNATKESLISFLSREGKTLSDYEKDIKDQMTLMRFKGRVILPKIKITDKDIEAHYLKSLKNASDSVELSLRQILIKSPTSENTALMKQKKELIEEAHLKLKSGLEFIKVEQIYSDLKDGREQLPARSYKLGDLNAKLYSHLKDLKENEFSSPIKTSAGYHIFFLVDKKFSQTKDFLAQKNKLEYELRMVEVEKQTINWIKAERSRSKINILSSAN